MGEFLVSLLIFGLCGFVGGYGFAFIRRRR